MSKMKGADLGGGATDVETAAARALASLGRELDLPARPFESVCFEHRRVLVRSSDRALLEGSLSAPRSLIAGAWSDEPGIADRVWAASADRWDWVRTCLQCDAAVQADWLALAESLRVAGELEEAQLV